MSQMFLRICLQRHGVVVLGVPGAVEQGNVPLAGRLQDGPPGLGLAVQLSKVAAPGLVPLGRIVADN